MLGERFYPKTLKRHGPPSSPGVLCVAGFGDDSSMFLPLVETELAARYRLVTFDLPGFGAEPALAGRDATLSNLATVVREVAEAERTAVVMAHSVASVIASLAARHPDSGIHTIISLEGNLTAADAYFSGLAADYENPIAFHEAFLVRLDEMAQSDPLIARYRSRVVHADPHALWSLGCDAAAFSARFVPGEVLLESSEAHYLYNPGNCADPSMAWLSASGMSAIELPGASHWATVDAPDLVVDATLQALLPSRGSEPLR